MKHRHTAEGYTETDEGIIPHLVIRVSGLIIKAPVKLRRAGLGILTNYRNWLPYPEREDGQLLYVLPGGITIKGEA